MVELLAWEDLEIAQVTPEGADTDYKVTLTHIPTGRTVSDVGPSAYRLRTALRDKITNEVYDG